MSECKHKSIVEKQLFIQQQQFDCSNVGNVDFQKKEGLHNWGGDILRFD